MTPTFKERLHGILDGFYGVQNTKKTQDDVVAEILSLVRGIVPPEFKPSGCIENDEAGGFNDCRQAILNEIGEDNADQE